MSHYIGLLTGQFLYTVREWFPGDWAVGLVEGATGCWVVQTNYVHFLEVLAPLATRMRRHRRDEHWCQRPIQRLHQ